jgi:hypothetical protein
MSTITADLGDDNVFALDANVAIDAEADQIWFTAKHSFADADEDAVVRKGLNVVGLSGIVVTDEATGTFDVTVTAEEVPDSLSVEALLYDCQLHRAATNRTHTVQEGVIRLKKNVTQTTV